MCVIAVKPKGTVISKSTLERCFESNSDGAGFVVRRNSNLIAEKGFFTFDAFWDAYERYEREVAVIHFRIKTHGNKDADMCHPFKITDKLYVAHNGIIDISTEDDKTKSDTWHFNELVLKPELAVDPSPLYRSSFQFLLGSTIGHSKLAFLDSRGKTVIINKEKGTMEGDVWYSNTSYKSTRGATSSRSRSSAVAYDSWADEWSYTPATTAATTTKKTEVTTKAKPTYANLEQVPLDEQWAVQVLRDFSMEDDEILNEVNADTCEDTALDLLVDYQRASLVEADLAEAASAEVEA
jgi:hypothetical protein